MKNDSARSRLPVVRSDQHPNSVRESEFREVVDLIQAARRRAMQAVNTTLVDLYWDVGRYISRKLETAAWGDGIVDQLARYIARQHPEIRGFARPNLFRMRQFYETYRHDEKVSPLVRQSSWTKNLLIFGKCKRPEEREFYLQLALRESWDKRELERQLSSGLFERAILSPRKASATLMQSHPQADTFFKDSYLLDFLNLPESHSEADLQKALVANLRKFLQELGRDFLFMGEQYLLQVGNRDFCPDLLFYHRELQSLVAIELKVDEFKPEYLGKLEFYLEALDRDVRKPHEKFSIGVLLCASKDSTIVEYALSRSMSPRRLLPNIRPACRISSCCHVSCKNSTILPRLKSRPAVQLRQAPAHGAQRQKGRSRQDYIFDLDNLAIIYPPGRQLICMHLQALMTIKGIVRTLCGQSGQIR